jgi:hypothetical protein
MLKRTVAIASVGLFLASTGVWAQNVGTGLDPTPDQETTRVATRGANFLEIPVGARGQALGGAGMALIRGVEAMAWNVAAVAESEKFSVGWTYSDLYKDADITHQFGGLILPLNEVSGIGVSVVALQSGEMLRTSEAYPDGGDPVYGETFDFTGFATSLGYSRLVTDRLSIGLALKFVSEGINNAKASWVGGDVGALFRTGLIGTTIGASITNVGGEARFEGPAVTTNVGQGLDAFQTGENVSVRYDTKALLLPTAFRFSALFDVTGTPEAWFPQVGPNHNVRLMLDFYDSISSPLQPSVGLEYAFRDFGFLRLGKRWLNEDRADFRDFLGGAAIGAGVKFPLGEYSLGIDYAFTDQSVLGNTQTFSINFGSF